MIKQSPASFIQHEHEVFNKNINISLDLISFFFTFPNVQKKKPTQHFNLSGVRPNKLKQFLCTRHTGKYVVPIQSCLVFAKCGRHDKGK